MTHRKHSNDPPLPRGVVTYALGFIAGWREHNDDESALEQTLLERFHLVPRFSLETARILMRQSTDPRVLH